jgi:hypothetical protein
VEEQNKRNNSPSRRFENAGDATKELFEGFNDWSGAVSTYGIQTAYAVIAANWAVYGNAQTILNNPWAKASMAIIIGFLGVNLLCIGLMTWLYGKRCTYANENNKRWQEEYERENRRSSSWPYTTFIERLGDFMRLLKVWAPVIGGVIFIIGLFSDSNTITEISTIHPQSK